MSVAKSPESIAVLALGNWGTALANHLASCGHDVLGWSHLPEIVNEIAKNRRNPTAFPEIVLHERFKVTASLEEALQRKIVLAVFPSSALQEMLSKFKPSEDLLFISALKGIDEKTLMTPLQSARHYFGSGPSLAVLSGPSFAIDLIQGRPLGIVAASSEEAVARRTADLFSAKNFKVYLSTDPIGVELGGIAKNAIAIAVGVCDGLAFGDSARAGLVTRGLAEIMRLASAMGASQQTLAGLSGLGDLVMTATCDTSRNRTVGLRLGGGETLDQIIQSLGSVAEGVRSAPLIMKLAEKYEIEMPITDQVTRLVRGEVSAHDAAKALLSRSTKKEF